MENKNIEAKDVQQALTVLNSLSDYFTIEHYDEYLSKLEIKQPIPTNSKRTSFIEPGVYLMDSDGDIYKSVNDTFPPIILVPSMHNSKKLELSNIIFCIGEYMTIPAVVNEFFGNFFPQENHTASTLQNVELPKEIVSPVDKVTRSFFGNKLKPKDEISLKSGKDITVTTADDKKVKQPLAPIVTVSLLKLPNDIEISREPNPFDNDVFVAVCSLFESGNTHFTGHDIYRTITGNANAKATDKILKLIDDSWTRLTTTMMRLDSGTMGIAYGFAQYIRDRRIIEGGRDKAIIQNQHGHFEVVVYTIMEKPMLLEYAQLLDQVSRFPAIEQNTPVQKNLEMLAIQNTLLAHIHAIPRLSNHILYETLYDLLKINDKMKESYIILKKKRTRDAIHKMLEYWKENGIIVSWKDIKQSNSFYAIEVITKNTQKTLTTKNS